MASLKASKVYFHGRLVTHNLWVFWSITPYRMAIVGIKGLILCKPNNAETVGSLTRQRNQPWVHMRLLLYPSHSSTWALASWRTGTRWHTILLCICTNCKIFLMGDLKSGASVYTQIGRSVVELTQQKLLTWWIKTLTISRKMQWQCEGTSFRAIMLPSYTG